MSKVTRAVVARGVRLPKKVFRPFIGLEGMYCNIVEQMVMLAY